MSIASRIESIEGHIGDVYDTLELGGSDLTNVDKNIVNINSELIDRYKDYLANGTDSIWNNWDKATETGVNEATINNTIKGKMAITPKGDTEQAILPSEYQQVEYIESTGTQYIDTNITPLNVNHFLFKGIVTSTSADACYYGVGLSGNFCLNTMSNMYQFGVGEYDNVSASPRNSLDKIEVYASTSIQKLIVNDNVLINKTDTRTISDTRNIYLFGRNTSNNVLSIPMSGKIYYFKMYNNDTLLRDFIPCYRKSDSVIGMYDLVNNVFYTNAGTGTFLKGSNTSIPSPDFPSPVKNVKGKNLFNINNEIFIKRINDSSISVSNNAVSITKVTTNLQERVTVYKQLNPYTTYTLSTGNTAGTGGYYGGYLAPVDSISTTAYPNNSDGLSATATTNSSGILAIIFYMNTAFVGTLTITNIQVEESSMVSPYLPYNTVQIKVQNSDNSQLQVVNISLGDIELCKIGDYQDYLYKENGNWYKYGAIATKTLTGSENTWTYNSTYKFFQLNNNSIVGQTGSGTALNNYFPCRIGNNTHLLWLFDYDEYFEGNVSTFTTWLSTHNTTVYYVLSTPTNTQITDTTLINQLNALEQAYSYNEQTNISQEANLPFVLDVTALTELS